MFFTQRTGKKFIEKSDILFIFMFGLFKTEIALPVIILFQFAVNFPEKLSSLA